MVRADNNEMARTKSTCRPRRTQLGGKSVRKALVRKQHKSLTPLHHAAIGGKVSILRALLKKGGAEVDKGDHNGRTPLHHAVCNSHPGAVEFLLAHDASVSAGDSASCTPFTFAAQQGHVKIFNLLLDKGASVSSVCDGGMTLLHYASIGGHLAIARILLERGISITEKDRKRWTALDHAVYHEHWDVVELLIKEGRRRWALCQSQRQHHDQPSDNTDDDDDALLLKLREGTRTSHDERIPGVLAAGLGLDNLLVRLFNVHGCHPDATTRRGVVPLSRAAENGHQGCVEVLLAHGADVNGVERSHGTTRRGNIPLALAAKNGHRACVKILLAHGADVNGFKGSHVSEAPESPLHCALRCRHDDVVGVLLGAGASPRPNQLDEYSANDAVMLLAVRGPSVAAQLLSRISSLDLLSAWLVEIASSKYVALLEEYFHVVAPTVRGQYIHHDQSDLPGITKLIHLLVQSQGTLSTITATEANSTRRRTRSSTSCSQDIRRTIVAALSYRSFVGVFFLLAVVDRQVLSEVFTDVPRIHEQAQLMLPSCLNWETDKELISRLAQVGYLYTLPAPPPTTFHDICNVGSAKEVQRWLQTMGKDIVNVTGMRNRTPLHVAAQAGNLEVVKLLVENGAELTAVTFRGSTAEKLADKCHREDVTAFLRAERQKATGGVNNRPKNRANGHSGKNETGR